MFANLHISLLLLVTSLFLAHIHILSLLPPGIDNLIKVQCFKALFAKHPVTYCFFFFI